MPGTAGGLAAGSGGGQGAGVGEPGGELIVKAAHTLAQVRAEISRDLDQALSVLRQLIEQQEKIVHRIEEMLGRHEPKRARGG